MQVNTFEDISICQDIYAGKYYKPSLRKEGPISNTLSKPPRINRFSHSSGAIRIAI